jgi:hypothetical protein
MWVFTRIDGAWEVGYYLPNGQFDGESRHDYKENAAARVNYLNGGIPESNLNEIRNSILEVAAGVQAVGVQVARR